MKEHIKIIIDILILIAFIMAMIYFKQYTMACIDPCRVFYDNYTCIPKENMDAFGSLVNTSLITP
jgi:hypothetical protein